ncbi:MAG: hypothetical protein R3E88_11190 [Myxococcota bacterium]|nr:hypothetical protein [Myxococcales bacterium]
MEALGTFAEFSLALAGFAAIALVLVERGGALPPGAFYVVRFMVVNAIGPALLSLLAIVVLAGGVPEPVAWRLCSGVYLAVALFFGLLSVRQQRRLASSGELLFTGALNAAVWSGAMLAHALEVANLAGVLGGPSLALFLGGLWMLLAVAGVQFVALLFLVAR